MARPALIIGLGGTGQWVLTYLKKDLLESNKGKMPKGVKLLSFDTTKHASAMAGHDNQGSKDKHDERQKRAGAVELEDKVEFVHMGSQLIDMVRDIRDGKHSHLGWVDAKDGLEHLPASAWNADDGAGAIRQVGRLCLVKDLQSPNTSKIFSYITKSMQDISQEVEIGESNRLEIIVVGSMSGGTGASMLIDLPLICRRLAKAHAGNIILRGFIVTPRAFINDTLGAGRDVMARSFAAWRELDRFMITSASYGSNQVQYHADNPALTWRADTRLFDVAYIIDPKRTSNSLDGVDPRKSVFPSISQAISAIVDDYAGQAYSYKAINLNDTYANFRYRPFYSSVGTYMMKVPRYYVERKFTYDLAENILEKLLAPEKNDQGRVIRLKDNHNLEVDESSIGVQAAVDFMNASGVEEEGVMIPRTLFAQIIGMAHREKYQVDGIKINSWSQPMTAAQGSQQLSAILDITTDETGSTIIEGFNVEQRFRIWDKVQPSREIGGTPGEDYNRIMENTRKESLNRYGRSEGGEETRGTYGDQLEEAKWAQLRLFNNLLRAKTAQILNGSGGTENPVAAKSGKLGYLYGFVKGLRDVLDYFDGFVDEVFVNRNEVLKLNDTAKSRMKTAADEYKDKKDKTCIFTVWDHNIHPDAHKAQREFLEAVEYSNQVRKSELLLRICRETGLGMKELAESTLKDIEKWVEHLATGITRYEIDKEGNHFAVGVHSLYHTIQDENKNNQLNHDLDQQLGRISTVLSNGDMKVDDVQLNETLSNVTWKVSQKTNPAQGKDGRQVLRMQGLEIGLEIKLDEDNLEKFVNDGETAGQHNLEILRSFAAKPFQTIAEQIPFGEKVQKEYIDADSLADKLDKIGEPLWSKTSTGAGPLHNQPNSMLIRVDNNTSPEASKYFQKFKNRLQDLNPGKQIELTSEAEGGKGSEDRYKMSLVRFDDVIDSQDFDVWEKCKDAYIQMRNDPSTDKTMADLHIFFEEKNACNYEERICKTLKKNYQPLATRITALLVDENRLEMFFRSLALGYIRKEEENWVYRESDNYVVMLSQATTQMAGDGEEKIGREYFDLINQFVIKAVDIRKEVSESYWIDFESLYEKIIKEEKARSEEVKSEYVSEATDENGIVQKLRSYVARSRRKEQNATKKQKIAVEQEQLADLAETIFRIAAGKL
ncbi:MAG: hypothetical protein JEZ06_15565 [Anaerolineaceae bacterium]|nr:hypothetical protein [Anaerolineaceae bacterium]